MVWFNNLGRMQTCEASINGFKQNIPASFVQFTGFKIDPPIPPCLAGFSGFDIRR